MDFKSLSIRTRMLAGFGTLAGVVLVVSGYSLHALGDATDGFNDYLNGLNARAEMAAQVRSAVDRRAIAARNLVLVADAAELEREKAEALSAHQDVQARLARLNEMVRQPGVGEEARKLVEAVAKVEADYGPVATGIVGLAVERKVEEAVSRIDKQCRPLLAALIKATDAYAEFTKARQQEMEGGGLPAPAQPADSGFAGGRGGGSCRRGADHACDHAADPAGRGGGRYRGRRRPGRAHRSGPA